MSLLQVLEKRKGAIAWKMSDIKGISPSYCTHKILMKDDYKPVIQPQRCLNPKVQDVVKNEIVKLLDSGLIYPISDSSWVSLIHVVPKKGGTTVFLNDNNELIPSRTVTGWRVILPNSNRTRRLRKDYIHLSLWDFCLPTYDVWIMQRTNYFSKMYDGNFPRHGGRLYGSIHGRFLGVRTEADQFDVVGFFYFSDSTSTSTSTSSSSMKLHHSFRICLQYGCWFGGKLIQKLRQKEVDEESCVKTCSMNWGEDNSVYTNYIVSSASNGKIQAEAFIFVLVGYILLMKDAKFDFSDDCKKAFNILKEKLTTTPIIISLDWNVPFELMCDASDFVVGAVLGQRIDGEFKLIYYASTTLNNAQEHYTTTKKELLAVVFYFDKFRPYLILSKTVVYTDHSDLKYLFSKQETNAYKVGSASSRDEPYSFKLCLDNVMRQCVAGNEILEILAHCHSGPTRGHHSASITGRKVYESGFFWPNIFKDAKDYVMRCDACQRSGNISSRSEMPQNNIHVCYVFDIWG
ncbi:reverse transcriptase domain-containing protein [Tanacetum coccineum]